MVPRQRAGRVQKIRLSWKWYDLWVGAYWDRDAHVLFVCPFPTVVIGVYF